MSDKIMLTLQDLRVLAATAERNGTGRSFPEVALQWAAGAQAEIDRLKAEAAKSERRAITFGDIVAQYTMAMRAACVAWKTEGADAGMTWIANTLCGPGHLPDVEAAKAEGGAQAMFDREMAEHEAFRAAHPAP